MLTEHRRRHIHNQTSMVVARERLPGCDVQRFERHRQRKVTAQAPWAAIHRSAPCADNTELDHSVAAYQAFHIGGQEDYKLRATPF
jgi:hypothetical protein